MNNASLNLIEEKIQTCNLCKNLLNLSYNTISFGKNTEILFVDESPAKNRWILTGKALYDINNRLLPTGKVLNQLLKIINLTIDDITFTEACKCHIPDRKFLKEVSNKCLSFLEDQINELNCKIVIPLGEYPTRIFKRQINNKVVLIIPIYHPSPINPKGYKLNVPIFEIIKDYIQEV